MSNGEAVHLEVPNAPPTGADLEEAQPVNLNEPALGLQFDDSTQQVTEGENPDIMPIWTQQQLDSIVRSAVESATQVAVQAALQAVSLSATAGTSSTRIDNREDSAVSCSLSEISKQIPFYSGDVQSKLSVEMWLDRVNALRERFRLSESTILLLATNRLSGRAADWYGTCPELLRATWNDFESKLRLTFHSDVDQIALFDQMRNRKWKNEPIENYYHDKLNLMRQLHLPPADMVLYLIRGIDDLSMRLQLKMLNCQIPEQLFVGMKSCAVEYALVKKDNYPKERVSPNRTDVSRKPVSSSNVCKSKTEPATVSPAVRCFNCFKDGHYSTSCPNPKREHGSCFACGSTQHQLKNCPERAPPRPARENNNALLIELEMPHLVRANVSAESTDGTSHVKSIDAVIDTGSPVSLIHQKLVNRFKIYPPDNIDPICFGLNGSPVLFVGRVNLNICINDCAPFTLLCYVVPECTMHSPFLLGRNFTKHPKLDVLINGNLVTVKEKSITVPYNEIFLMDLMLSEPPCNLNVCESVPHAFTQKLYQIYDSAFNNASKPPAVQSDFIAEIRLVNDHETFNFPPRRLSHADKQAVHEIVTDLLERGIVKASRSPYASPIVLCNRKDGTRRLCIDFRALNKVAKRDRYPLPLIDDQLDQLSGKSYFSKIDLKDAFYNVRLSADSTKYTAFVTPTGQYEFTRLPFGYCNGPALFARFIADIFRPLLEQGKLIIYLDDILIATSTIEENLMILAEVFELLATNDLQLKIQKCSFLHPSVEYLGYLIDENGIHPNPEHVKGVSAFPVPINVKQTQSFLGLCSYFRRFIPNFSVIAKPLYDLTKKDTPFYFGESELKAMENLKSELMREPVLAIYSPTAETELHCDASSLGFGGVLMQRQPSTNKFHPICYFSKRTSECEAKYHSYELECLAIIYALKKFDVYLRGIPFKVVTDCNSLKMTMSKKDVVPRIMRWVLYLQDFNYTIEHRTGDRMKHVDALSRVHQIHLIEENSFDFNLALKQQADPNIKIIRDQLENGDIPFYELRNGIVYKTHDESLLFYVPGVMESSVLRAYHDQMGHCGIDKTEELIQRSYWFPNMHAKIKEHISNCLKCIVFNPNSGRKEGFLHSIPKGNRPFDTLHIDHLTLEKSTSGFKYLFVVVDSFTKYVRLYPCRTTNHKEVLNHLKSYMSYYSAPKRVISDRGTAFMSRNFEEFMFEYGVQTVHVASGSPQANGQVERFNRTLIPILAKIAPSSDRWDQVIDKVEFFINNTVNRSTGYSPSKLLFGLNQRMNGDDKLRDVLDSELNTEFDLSMIETIRDNAEEQIKRSHLSNQSCFDKRRKPPRSYKLGDHVVIVNTDVTAGLNKKLLPKYKGPYVISKILDNDRYVVKDIDGFQMSQRPFDGVFEAARMRPWSSDL